MVFLPKLMGKREGMLIVDHSASPGLPEDIARASGYDPEMVKEGRVAHMSTLTCAHCRVGVIKNPLRARERNYCAKCSGRYVCDFCALKARQPDYEHAQFEKVADETMNSALKYDGLVLGSAMTLLHKTGLLR